MATKAMDLFEAFAQNKLPKDAGFIISSNFSTNSAYSTYEIVFYSDLKSVSADDEGLRFEASGKSLHILVEPADYAEKTTEPPARGPRERLPLSFNQLDEILAKNQSRLLISKKPIIAAPSFNISRPTGIDFALIFYKQPDIHETLFIFFEKTYNKEAGIPLADAKKSAARTIELLKEASI